MPSLYSPGVTDGTITCSSGAAGAARRPRRKLVTWLQRFVGYAATKRAIYEALNRDSEMSKNARDAMYEAGEPLFVRAQEAGQARTGTSFDDVLRMVSGAGFVDEEQPDRVLQIALDGVRRAQ
jgi:hypothetical protein